MANPFPDWLVPMAANAGGLSRLRAHWVRPEVVVEAGFIEWTGHGKLRHPRLLGVRADTAPGAVVRKSPVRAARLA